jgi:2,4-dienoyl-CoA reductase-like NADH-dependent reductase (Old Yellow Enzyme family)
MDGLGFGFHGKCKTVNLFEMKKAFEGLVIGNVGFTRDTAEGAVRTGAADLIAFGRAYISNPDLVEKF